MMKRKIKFRSWDKISKTMKDVKDMYWNDYGICKISGRGCKVDYGFTQQELSPVSGKSWENSDDDFVIMQYIGMVDINEKEIYEDDIVQTDCGQGRVVYGGGEYQLIDDNGHAIDVNGDDETSLGCTVKVHRKIIGNIYET